tara:strand:+ start:203 stop:406 length:204 start_codon:yes stop_codon:yes gene_type:complete
MRSIGLSRFVQYIKNNKILNYVLFKDISKDSKIIFPEILKNKLLNDIVELESILNVDLTKWKTRLKD